VVLSFSPPISHYRYNFTLSQHRVCSRCLSLKDSVVGHTDESGVTLPPLYPRCRCTIMYKEQRTRGLAAGNIDVTEGGKSPHLIGHIDFKDATQVKQALDWFESIAVNAPVENAMIITATGEVYHCTGGLNTLDTIVELDEKLYGAIVTHNHPVGSANEYSFSDADKNLFMDFKLARLRGIDERFVYEFNRNFKEVDNIVLLSEVNEFNARHGKIVELARKLKIGYRRWAR